MSIQRRYLSRSRLARLYIVHPICRWAISAEIRCRRVRSRSPTSWLIGLCGRSLKTGLTPRNRARGGRRGRFLSAEFGKRVPRPRNFLFALLIFRNVWRSLIFREKGISFKPDGLVGWYRSGNIGSITFSSYLWNSWILLINRKMLKLAQTYPSFLSMLSKLKLL